MTPSIAGPGELPGDPQVGTPEYERMQRLYTEAIERVAKLRHMETRLPEAIADAERRCRDLSARLGLPSASAGGSTNGKPRRSRDTRPRVLAALPGTVGQIARRLGVTTSAVEGALRALARDGLAVKDPGYGGTWRRVEREEEAA